MDGLSEVTLEDVASTVRRRNLDVVCLVETKRREEQTCIDISLPGFSLREARRSNISEDKDGGGIAVYTRLTDGVLFKAHTPDILDPAHSFLRNERMWQT